jgi:hypothetical protein
VSVPKEFTGSEQRHFECGKTVHDGDGGEKRRFQGIEAVRDGRAEHHTHIWE